MNHVQQAIVMIFLVGILVGSLVYGQHQESPPAATGNPPPAASPPFSHAVVQEFEHSLAKVQPWLERYGYAAVFVAVMVEGMGIPAPGQTLVIAGTLEAARGNLHPSLLLILVVLAAVLGNSVGYLIGYWGGRPLLKKLKVNVNHWQRLKYFFDRYGGGVVVAGRFFDGLRQLNGIVAGMLKMPWWLFTGFNILGAVLWTGLWGLGTYLLEKDIHTVVYFFRPFKPWIIALSLTGFAALLAYLLWRRQANQQQG
jgi:membrane protein DedA with SNARE-associated domain